MQDYQSGVEKIEKLREPSERHLLIFFYITITIWYDCVPET